MAKPDDLDAQGGSAPAGVVAPASGKRELHDLARTSEIMADTDESDFLGLEPGIDPRETYTGDSAYNQQVYRGLLCVSDYQKVLIRAIIRAQFFKETKDALITIVAGLFDKTEVLAKTKNVWLEYIDVEIILAQARIGFAPYDVDNPQLANITNMILKHYRQYASRSEKGWERGLQNKIETSHTAEYKQSGFLRGGGGGGATVAGGGRGSNQTDWG